MILEDNEKRKGNIKILKMAKISSLLNDCCLLSFQFWEDKRHLTIISFSFFFSVSQYKSCDSKIFDFKNDNALENFQFLVIV